ncbi:MAG: thiamine diphosphokinase [Candidatus Limnocylindrales bacterium]
MSGPIDAQRAPRAIVVADGEVPARAALDGAWPGWDGGSPWVVAADAGGIAALALGLRPDLVVGDFDSIAPADLERLRAMGIPLDAHPAEKDESDTELAVRAALDRGCREVTILGALGGPRVDHALANLWLLALPAAAGRVLVVLDARSRLRLLSGPGRLELPGVPGDLVTLLPFDGPAAGVTTEGLAYPLRDESLVSGPSRGLSNLRTDPKAAVSLRAGRLLIVETHQAEGATS